MIVNEGSTSSGTLSSMESSNIGMICSCYGSMPTLFLKYLLTNVLYFSLKLIWTLSKIVKKCWKYSSRSSKLLLSLWLFKEFSHCIIFNLFRFATGKSTGIVLDSGDGVTHVIPVYDGYSLAHSCERIDFAGRNVTEHLRNLLRKSGLNMDTSAEF